MSVRFLTEAERQALEAGLRSKASFVLRRCQIVLLSAKGQRPKAIARSLGCASQTVRNTIHAFETEGVDSLLAKSRRPKTVEPVLTEEKREKVQAILHQSPRVFGKEQSAWTLSLLAEVCCEEGLSETCLSAPTVLLAVRRLGASWKRAKSWITSPDPSYARKKSEGTA